jgi:hypothetical protein
VTNAIRNTAALIPAIRLFDLPPLLKVASASDPSLSIASKREERMNTNHPAADINRKLISDPNLRMRLTNKLIIA